MALGGVDAVIVENFGDAPFAKGAVSPYTVAAMTRLVEAVITEVGHRPVGVNVLRNDARSALAVAAATGAQFIRVNVHSGAMVTDQGTIEGDARATLLDRRRLQADVRIVADVLVKHAVPLGNWTLEQAASDTARRGLADVLVVTGTGTGQPTRADDLQRVRDAAPSVPVWIGSGITTDSLPTVPFDGAIVGTALHMDGDCREPVDPDRVRHIRAALDGIGSAV